MARVINGLLRGRVGDMVFRVRNGKQVVSARPAKVNQPDTEEYRSRISLFAFCCTLDAAINKILVFSESWKKSKVKVDSNLNKMLFVNRPKIKPGFDISGAWLVDDFKYSAELISHNFSGNDFTAVLTADSAPGLSKLVSLQGIVQLLEPIDENVKPYNFFPVVSPDYPITTEDITFTINFSSQDIESVKLYTEKKILFNLAYKSIGGKVLGFSGSKYIS